jgi:[glutamine synthetase] adenylyltransferase / [glutamine synthetase]-adenylyl-L-tyrosine phosphorylase
MSERTEEQAVVEALFTGINRQLAFDFDFRDQLRAVVNASDYVFHALSSQPDLLSTLYHSGDLWRPYYLGEYQQRLNAFIQQADDVKKALRVFRQREILRLIWRDITSFSETHEILAETSALAIACIRQSVRYATKQVVAKFGEPVLQNGKPATLHVIAMGKLGGDELNLSSDIDLIFCYPDVDQSKQINLKIDAQWFFTKIAQQVISLLNEATESGFVFRVDMRLRPFGESGPMVMSCSSLYDYWDKHAEFWERYACVKARVVCGERETIRDLRNHIKSFVYQSTSNDMVIAGLLRIKSQICRRDSRAVSEDHLKLGIGGIREIEFIIQAFQLINGREDEELRETPLKKVLVLLKDLGYLRPSIAGQFEKAYDFLRRTENHLQAKNDQQMHTLPHDEAQRQALAISMGFNDWAAFDKKLSTYRHFVTQRFNKMIIEPLAQTDDRVKRTIETFNFQSLLTLEAELKKWFAEVESKDWDVDSDYWNSFKQKLSSRIRHFSDPVMILYRLTPLMEAILSDGFGRILRYHHVASRLIRMCAASTWVPEYLRDDIALLTHSVTTDTFDFPTLATRRVNLGKALDLAETFDEKTAALHHYREKAMMRIAIADTLHKLPVMRVSDLLTDVAIAIVDHVQNIVWRWMVTEYGRPERDDGSACELDFIVLAYGKLGGIELGYVSDLDLVFLHGANEQAMTSGGKTSITGAQFYQRLTQKMIQLLSEQTAFGRLYYVDTRLRPMGRSSNIVTSFSAFKRYQEEDAWTWEHQALVRARVISGDDRLSSDFKQLRESILGRARDEAKLKQDIIEMREKMRVEHTHHEDEFNLKRDPGGITDIEFLAQYVVLAWSYRQPELLIYTDNIRILETAETAGLLSRGMVDGLCEAYRRLRNKRHHLALRAQPGRVSKGYFLTYRQLVTAAWLALLGAGV